MAILTCTAIPLEKGVACGESPILSQSRLWHRGKWAGIGFGTVLVGNGGDRTDPALKEPKTVRFTIGAFSGSLRI